MKKTIIKCDKCERELTDKDVGYYEFNYQNIPGWATFRHPYPGGAKDYCICLSCFEKYLKIKL